MSDPVLYFRQSAARNESVYQGAIYQRKPLLTLSAQMPRQAQCQTRESADGICGRADWHDRHVANIEAGGASDLEVFVDNRLVVKASVAIGFPGHPQGAAGMMHSTPTEWPLFTMTATVFTGNPVHIIELREDTIPSLVEQIEKALMPLCPSCERGKAELQQIIQKREALEADFRGITVVGVREDAILIVQAVGEAELNINAGLAGVVNHWFVGRIIVSQVPVFVIDVHLYIKGKLNMAVMVRFST